MKWLCFAIPLSLCMTVIGTCWSCHQIEIAKKENQLILYKDGKVEKTYSVATGKTPDKTPEGTFTLGVKINQPGWKKISGGDPKNPLGPRWLGFSTNNDTDRARNFGIHGTTKPTSIGTHASNGCIRMHNEKVVELSSIVSEGTPIWIHSNSSTGEWKGDLTEGITPMEKEATVSATQATILSGCSRGASSKAVIPKDTCVKIIGMVKDWYQIEHLSKIGFIHKKDLTLLAPLSTVKADPSIAPNKIMSHTQTVTIRVKTANVREKPSTQAAIIQQLNKGGTASVIRKQKNWFYICLSNGKKAYLHQSVTTGPMSDNPQELYNQLPEEMKKEAISYLQGLVRQAEKESKQLLMDK